MIGSLPPRADTGAQHNSDGQVLDTQLGAARLAREQGVTYVFASDCNRGTQRVPGRLRLIVRRRRRPAERPCGAVATAGCNTMRYTCARLSPLYAILDALQESAYHDVLNRTETAMSQAHCFLACQLALRAESQARRLGYLSIDEDSHG